MHIFHNPRWSLTPYIGCVTKEIPGYPIGNWDSLYICTMLYKFSYSSQDSMLASILSRIMTNFNQDDSPQQKRLSNEFSKNNLPLKKRICESFEHFQQNPSNVIDKQKNDNENASKHMEENFYTRTTITPRWTKVFHTMSWPVGNRVKDLIFFLSLLHFQFKFPVLSKFLSPHCTR